MSRGLRHTEIRPRRGLRREEAALYVGIGVTKFDELVADGRMPLPIEIGTAKVWDILALDIAFDALRDAQASGGDDEIDFET